MARFEPVLMRGIGERDLTDIETYKQLGGFVALEKALRQMAPESVANVVSGSNLRGRGGAGFPTGKKWSFLPKDGRPRYLVCNSDEAEPGTFKDRMLLEQTPLQIIEGLVISAYAIGAAAAYMYVRGEFLEGSRILRRALESARERKYVGPNIFGTGYSVDILLHRG